MAQTNAGIAGALGINVPRLTLIPARCAIGISQSGAGFRVIHTMSGKELGIVARTPELVWGYIPARTSDLQEAEWGTADAAAIALDAHILDHKLATSGEVA